MRPTTHALFASLALSTLPFAATAAGKQLDVYSIGNSLTASLAPDRFHEWFAQRGIDLQFGMQISGDKSLIRHLNYVREVVTSAPLKGINVELPPRGFTARKCGSIQ